MKPACVEQLLVLHLLYDMDAFATKLSCLLEIKHAVINAQ